MAEERIARRLAAILAADVVGYSRMMGADEEGTLAAIKAIRRELFHPKVAEHHGRIVKTTGDGALVEFPQRRRCGALRARRATRRRRAQCEHSRGPAHRIPHRHQCRRHHFSDDGDIYGDGVNIAARIEPLAEPGAICLSDNAYQQIKGKLSVDVTDMGEQQLKNIAQPVRVYGIRPAGAAAAAARPALSLPDRPSIAVLPFQNMSGDRRAGLFRRRHGRGHHHRPLAHQMAVRHRAQFDLHLQGPCRRREAGRPRARRALCARRQRAQGGAIACASPASSSTPRPAPMSGPSATTASPTIFSRFRTRSRCPSSAPSSRACASPRSSASNASAPTASMPTILSCRRSPMSIRAIPSARAKALALLERALALDPTYALAHAYAAECHHSLFLRGGLPRRTAATASIRHAETAIAHGHDDALGARFRRLRHRHGQARSCRGLRRLRRRAGGQPFVGRSPISSAASFSPLAAKASARSNGPTAACASVRSIPTAPPPSSRALSAAHFQLGRYDEAMAAGTQGHAVQLPVSACATRCSPRRWSSSDGSKRRKPWRRASWNCNRHSRSGQFFCRRLRAGARPPSLSEALREAGLPD